MFISNVPNLPICLILLSLANHFVEDIYVCCQISMFKLTIDNKAKKNAFITLITIHIQMVVVSTMAGNPHMILWTIVCLLFLAFGGFIVV